jgi:hypothetical protein
MHWAHARVGSNPTAGSHRLTLWSSSHILALHCEWTAAEARIWRLRSAFLLATTIKGQRQPRAGPRRCAEQLALETICCIEGEVTLPPTVGDRLTYKGRSEMICVRITDGALSRCHRHSFDLPNILFREICVVEDETARNSATHAEGDREGDVDLGRAHIGDLVERERRARCRHFCGAGRGAPGARRRPEPGRRSNRASRDLPGEEPRSPMPPPPFPRSRESPRGERRAPRAPSRASRPLG